MDIALSPLATAPTTRNNERTSLGAHTRGRARYKLLTFTGRVQCHRGVHDLGSWKSREPAREITWSTFTAVYTVTTQYTATVYKCTCTHSHGYYLHISRYGRITLFSVELHLGLKKVMVKLHLGKKKVVVELHLGSNIYNFLFFFFKLSNIINLIIY